MDREKGSESSVMTEQEEKRRAKKTRYIGLRARLILIVMVALIFIVLLVALLNLFIHGVLQIEYRMPLVLEYLIFCIVIGAIVSSILGKLIFKPLYELEEAMEKVADGDYDVRLNEDSKIREIHEVYAGFNLMTKQLQGTEILQTDFVSNVSHEFKTPINAIEGYATLLQDEEHTSSEERTEYVGKILQNSKRLSHLVSDILLLSKVDNEAIQEKQTTFRLDEQIRQAIVLLEPEWTKKNIEFDVEMEEIEITANESLLYHVWYNLLSNAIKFDPDEGGIVRIYLVRRNKQVIFEVEDNGPGVPEESKKRIFDKFYQGEGAHKYEGNGLGLALVKKILNLTNGEVAVENLSGGGARFTVVLKDC